MDAVELFATLLAQRRRVGCVEYSSFPAYKDLFKAGLIEEAGVVSSLTCEECDQPHDAPIVYESSQYGYYCPDLGFTAKSRAELIAIRPNLGSFVAQIADTLACKRRKSTPLDNNTWRIGSIESPTGDVVLYLHPTLRDAQDIRDFQTALTGEMKAHFGIVLTSNGTLSVPPLVTAQLQDMLGIDPVSGKLTVFGDLRAIAGVPDQRTGGRPNDFREKLSNLMAQRANEGRSIVGRNDEAKALQAEFAAKFPNEKCPALSTVKRYVSEVRTVQGKN